MSNGSDLLRMLEPAVRPGGVPGSQAGKVRPGPIETRDFDSLLAEAQQNKTEELSQDKTTIATDKATEKAMIAQLSQVNRVENSSLVNLIGQNSSDTTSQDLPGSTSIHGDK